MSTFYEKKLLVISTILFDRVSAYFWTQYMPLHPLPTKRKDNAEFILGGNKL